MKKENTRKIKATQTYYILHVFGVFWYLRIYFENPLVIQNNFEKRKDDCD